MNHYLTTFLVEMDVKLDDLQRQLAFRTLNRWWVGKEKIPLTDVIPEALRDAAFATCRTVRVQLTVGLKPDGGLEIIND